MPYAYTPIPFRRPPELDGRASNAPVAIIGAGPVGLALAIDLAQRGVKSVVLDEDNTVSLGSRAICWAKRTLEIFGRLGVGQKMLDKGVTWKVGRLFHGESEVFSFDLLPEPGHHYPAFVNLQQYYVEEYLIARCAEFPALIDLRFSNLVTDHRDLGDRVQLDVQTEDGAYVLEATYVVACDGAKSPTRKRMGLAFEGQTFDEQFLIADVEMDESPFGASRVPERWFWFDPPFDDGRSALLHAQPDNIYRIDWQLPVGTDGAAELEADRLAARIRKIVGDKAYRLDWASVYRFRCMRLERFVHGRIIFAGDSAHVVSPFGARGGNGGIQDIDNLGWKLAATLDGTAGPGLLATYDEERGHAADENILNSARATNFMTPKSEVEALFRREALRLAHDHDFARRLLNSGRLSAPCSLAHSSLTTPAPVTSGRAPGLVMIDAPLNRADGSKAWLLDVLPTGFSVIHFGAEAIPPIAGLASITINPSDYDAETGQALEARYGLGSTHLVRPDHHVAARFSGVPSPSELAAALMRSLANGNRRAEAAE